MKKIFLFLFSFVTLFLLFSKDSYASDGLIELRSTNEKPYRCFSASLLMQDNRYTILVSCRNLIYPAVEPNINSYVAWANPKDGGNPMKLGVVGLGKATFRANKPFVSIFITTESNPNTRTPSGEIVMKGNLEPITFLESETTPTPTSFDKETKETISPTPKILSTKEKLILALKRAGLAALLALVGLIGLIFVITRSRG